MSAVQFTDLGEGRFALEGRLEFETASSAYTQSMIRFSPYTTLELDLSGVSAADSAGLALMLEWVHWAKASAREIRFRNVPDQVRNIARISEVEDILKAGERWIGPVAAEDGQGQLPF